MSTLQRDEDKCARCGGSRASHLRSARDAQGIYRRDHWFVEAIPGITPTPTPTVPAAEGESAFQRALQRSAAAALAEGKKPIHKECAECEEMRRQIAGPAPAGTGLVTKAVTDPAETEAGAWEKRKVEGAGIQSPRHWWQIICPALNGRRRIVCNYLTEADADTILRGHALAAKVPALEAALRQIIDNEDRLQAQVAIPSAIRGKAKGIAMGRAALDALHSAGVGR